MLSSGFSVTSQSALISSSLEAGRFSGPGTAQGIQGPQALCCCVCQSNSLASAVSQAYTPGAKSNLHKEFLGPAVPISKQGLCFQKCDSKLCWVPHAVLLAPAESSQEHVLDGNLQLKVKAIPRTPGSPTVLEFQIGNCYLNAPVLHWGLTKPGMRNWSLPANLPEGTRVFQNQALQTPFQKTGDVAFLTMDVHDTQLEAIEFLLKDDSNNQWLKLHGGNFRLVLPEPDFSLSKVSIPEKLVQVQSYLRWERKGKQMYSPDEQEREYEEARKELQEQVLKGASLETLQSNLLGGEAKDGKRVDSKERAKKTGIKKKNIRKSIQRKKRDPLELLTVGFESQTLYTAPVAVKEPTALELAVEVIEGRKNVFKIGENSLLVLVTDTSEEPHVIFITDAINPLVVHWAVSKHCVGEWQLPPESIIPSDSTILQGACETSFIKTFNGDSSLQSLEIAIKESNIIGIPFVLRSGDTWMNNNGSNFYISLEAEKKPRQPIGDGKGTAKWLLEEIARLETDAERSLMHRFNIATDLTKEAMHGGEVAFVAILVWMRFMATRQLTWNKNYNVKPREISAAQDRLTDVLQGIFRDQPANREIIRLIMSTVGRGGQGDVGQRIRDEILVIQRNNDCKGAMMEEWHQKLHNNTSPDDVVICQALIDYVKANLNIEAYWKTLKSNGVTKERLASYDRPIVSEPQFRADQKEGLIRDLTAYLRTLKAVHSGADLESAIATCLGYSSEGEGFMGGVKIHPVKGLSSDVPALLESVLDHVEDKEVISLLEGLLESRCELQPSIKNAHDRLRDIIFLDLALDSTVRTAVERGLEAFNKASTEDIIYAITLVIENLCLSSDNNEEFVYCLKDWFNILKECKDGRDQWPLKAKAILDRTRLALADKAEHYHKVMQPSAEYLGMLLGIEQWAIDTFTEEMIRSGSAASLSQLLNRLDPMLRSAAHLGSWQIISPVEASGYVETVDELGEVQDKIYRRPTILVASKVKGEEEIPDGAVAVLTPDMPDVLSHVSVRARNGKVCFATCFDSAVLSDLQAKEGMLLKLQPTSSDLIYNEISEAEVSTSGETVVIETGAQPGINLTKKMFGGRYAVAADEFNNDLVGAKSRNIAQLTKELPAWIKVPTSVAIPFGVFETVLSDKMNKDVAAEIRALNDCLKKGDFSKLHDIRQTVLKLEAPPQLVEDLRDIMKGSNMPWPGDEGPERWKQAWTAIKKVWASKWNERAYFSTRKAKINHEDLCMAVLVQEVVQADYAFVIHTINPSNGDSSEIYAEVVKGLGETLVGAYSGRALSFIAKKEGSKTPKILGFPSKRVGLFIKQSIIFRSDSNGEDLEGYAGAGLYDSVPMDEEQEKVVDYSSDPLLVDKSFQSSILSNIAEAGEAVEALYGAAQDIEGVIKEGELYLVQTRPQM